MQFSVHFLAGGSWQGEHSEPLCQAGVENLGQAWLGGGIAPNPTRCVCLLELGYLCEMGFEWSAALLGARPCTNSQAKRSTGFNSVLSQAAAWAAEAHRLLAQSFLSAQVLFPRGGLLSFKPRGQKRSSLRKTDFPVRRCQDMLPSAPKKKSVANKKCNYFLMFLFDPEI